MRVDKCNVLSCKSPALCYNRNCCCRNAAKFHGFLTLMCFSLNEAVSKPSETGSEPKSCLLKRMVMDSVSVTGQQSAVQRGALRWQKGNWFSEHSHWFGTCVHLHIHVGEESRVWYVNTAQWIIYEGMWIQIWHTRWFCIGLCGFERPLWCLLVFTSNYLLNLWSLMDFASSTVFSQYVNI